MIKIKNTILFLISTVLFQFSITAQNNTILDEFGRPVVNEHGGKLNYTKKETIDLMELHPASNFEKYTDDIKMKGQGEKFSSVWKYTILSDDIGRKSMHSMDIDNDGQVEIVSS